MAIVFQLVIGFSPSAWEEAEAAVDLASKARFRVRDSVVEIGKPFVSHMKRAQGLPSLIQVSAHPRGVGYGGPGNLPFQMTDRTAGDLHTLGEDLYELLREMTGYSAAYVGWDSEWLVDTDELESDWLEDGSIYELSGLVLAEPLAERWALDERFEPFDPGFRWLPYTGTSI